MKRTALALTFILTLLVSSMVGVHFGTAQSGTVSGGSWVTRAPMQVARANLGVAAVNGDIYAIGGNTITGAYLPDQGFMGMNGGPVNTNEQYDPSTNSWTIKAPMPTSRDSFAIAVFQNKIYCIGGRASISEYQPQTFTTVNEVYDPATDTWQTKVPLPTAQWPLQASVVNGNIYVICGSGETYAYNPINDSWTTKAKAPSVYTWPTGFVTAVVDNGIYVIGMSEYNLIYYPLNDSWSQVSSIQPYPSELLLEYGFLDAAAGATTGMSAPEKIYVFFDNQTYVYDTDYNTWTLGAGMPSERVDYGLAVMNDTFFIIGGSNNVYTDMNGRYFPVNANEQYIPIGYGTPDPSYVLEHTPPAITLLSPLNQTYNASGVSLVFTEDKAVNWTDYSLDGKQNVTITGNTTLINIANGLHNITIYANDTLGNTGASQTINFTIAKPESFPTLPVVAFSAS